MCQKTWWLVSAVLTIAAFGGGVGVGFLWRAKGGATVDAAPRPDAETKAPTKPPAPPSGMHLEHHKDAERLLHLAFQPGILLQFSGDKYVKFWAELETNGETRQIVQVSSRPFVQFAGPIPHDAGDVVWLRVRTGTPGTEIWRMVLRGKNSTQFAVMEAYLFGRVPIRSTQDLLPAPVHEIPEPLPLDRPVCLHEAREISELDDRVQLVSNVGVLGSAALTDPLTKCALLAAPRTAGICTIRLMCRVEPDNVVPGK
jgi:hypothetical protein